MCHHRETGAEPGLSQGPLALAELSQLSEKFTAKGSWPQHPVARGAPG